MIESIKCDQCKGAFRPCDIVAVMVSERPYDQLDGPYQCELGVFDLCEECYDKFALGVPLPAGQDQEKEEICPNEN